MSEQMKVNDAKTLKEVILECAKIMVETGDFPKIKDSEGKVYIVHSYAKTGFYPASNGKLIKFKDHQNDHWEIVEEVKVEIVAQYLFWAGGDDETIYVSASLVSEDDTKRIRNLIHWPHGQRYKREGNSLTPMRKAPTKRGQDA
jgi:hypothetical protein